MWWAGWLCKVNVIDQGLEYVNLKRESDEEVFFYFVGFLVCMGLQIEAKTGGGVPG